MGATSRTMALTAAADVPRARSGINIEGLTFSYKRASIFSGFEFYAEAPVSIIRGPSGCGKTTLLKLMYGLTLPGRVSRWEVPSPAYLVLQDDTLVPWLTGKANFQKFSRRLWDEVVQGPFYHLLRPIINKRACEM